MSCCFAKLLKNLDASFSMVSTQFFLLVTVLTSLLVDLILYGMKGYHLTPDVNKRLIEATLKLIHATKRFLNFYCKSPMHGQFFLCECNLSFMLVNIFTFRFIIICLMATGLRCISVLLVASLFVIAFCNRL